MDAQKFVDVVRELTIDGGVRIVQSGLTKPPGRKPSDALVNMSTWYNSLDDGGKSMCLKIIEFSARTSIFQFFCMLDNVVAFENENKGELKLYYERGDERTLLNKNESFGLHDLL